MSDNHKIIPGFHAVEFMRQAREKLSRELEGKSFEEIRRMMDETMAKWPELDKQRRGPTSSR